MRLLIGKYWYIYLIIIIIILIVAVVVHSFKETSCFAAWIYSFINDWSALFSAIAAFLAASIALMALKETGRSRDFKIIANWARDSLNKIQSPLVSEMHFLQWDELEEKLSSIISDGVQALSVAEKYGGDLNTNIKKAYAETIKLKQQIAQADRAKDVFPSLEVISIALAEVISSASR